MNRALFLFLLSGALLLADIAHGKPKKVRLEYPVEQGIVRQLDAITVFTKMPEGKIEPYMSGTMIESLHAQMALVLGEAGKDAAKKRPGETPEDFKKRWSGIFEDIDDFSPSDLFFFVPGKGSDVPGNGVIYDEKNGKFSLVLPSARGLIMNKIVMLESQYKIWDEAVRPVMVNRSEEFLHLLVFDQPGPMAPLSLPMEPDKARQLQGKLRAGYIASLSYPYMGQGVSRIKPSVKAPADKRTIQFAVFAHLRRGLIFREDTGEILAQRDY